MYPYLLEFHLSGQLIRVPSYGIFLVIAFTTGYFLALKRAIRVDIDPRDVENLFIITVLASILGSRLFHVVFEEFGYYWEHPGKILAVWEGGYTFYGALLAGIFAMFQYCFIKKVSFLRIMDIASESTSVGLFIGRIGCFFAGCCWGKATDMPWGVVFKHVDGAVNQAKLHPTQIYEAFLGLGIFLYIRWLFPKEKYVGQVFFHSIITYAIGRFIIELFRGDDYRGFMFGGALSYSQFVSLAIIPFAMWGMMRERSKS